MKKPTVKSNGPDWEAVSSFVAAGRTVVGIDEVGRGAWAGPVVAAAVALPAGLEIPYINDSKLVSAPGRNRLNREIRRYALAVGVGWVGSGELDEYGLSWAIRESGLRALSQIALPDAVIILDGKHNYLAATHDSHAIVRADATVVPVSAASIVAKVARDRYMRILARRHVGYGFESHKGYGTFSHQEALRRLGPSAQHRTSWAPFRRLLDVHD